MKGSLRYETTYPGEGRCVARTGISEQLLHAGPRSFCALSEGNCVSCHGAFRHDVSENC